jgi:hypothetical protein
VKAGPAHILRRDRRDGCARIAFAIGACFACSSIGARSARAAEVHVERAEGAGTCPDAAAIEARVQDGAIGRDARTRAVTVTFERTTRGYRSTIRTPDGLQRSLADDATTCDGLAEATVLAVRLALEVPEPVPRGPVTTSANATPPSLAPSTPGRDRAPDEAPRTASKRAVGVEVLAAGAVAFGIGSPLAPGLRGGASLTFAAGRWSAGLTGLVLPSQTRQVGLGEVDVLVAGGGVEACHRLRVARPVLVALCGRAEALMLSGTARGFATVEEHARPVFLGTLLARGQARLGGPVAAFAEGGVVAPVIRERFEIQGVGLVYDPPPVGATAAFGALVDFE